MKFSFKLEKIRLMRKLLQEEWFFIKIFNFHQFLIMGRTRLFGVSDAGCISWSSKPSTYVALLLTILKNQPRTRIAVEVKIISVLFSQRDPNICLGQNAVVTECDLEVLRRLYNCTTTDKCKPETWINYPERKWYNLFQKSCDYLWLPA